MERVPTDEHGEPIETWKRLVHAAWTLNYVARGLQPVLPRLRAMAGRLDEIDRLIPCIQTQPATDTLESELKQAISQFGEAAELLEAACGRMRDFLRRLDDRPTQPTMSAD
jgi:hypothetical protein